MRKIAQIRLFFGLLNFIIITSAIAFFIMAFVLPSEYFIIPFFIAFLALVIAFFSGTYLYIYYFRDISKEAALTFSKEKNWNQINLSEETKKSDEDTLKKFFYLIYPNKSKVKYDNILFAGENESAPFYLSTISFCMPTSKATFFEPAFVLKTSPIKNFDNTILITPSYLPIINSKILSEVYMDTHNQLHIYAKDTKKAKKYIKNPFLSAFIDYYHKIDTEMALLLTPENILFIKPKKHSKAFFQFFLFISVIFRSAKNIEEEYQREYNQILDILKVLNLLKKD